MGAKVAQKWMSEIRKIVKPPSLAQKLGQAKERERLKVMRARSKLGKLVSETQRSKTKGQFKGKLRKNFFSLKLQGVTKQQLKVQIAQMGEVVKIRQC